MKMTLEERIAARAISENHESVSLEVSNFVKCAVCSKKIEKGKIIKQGNKYLCGYRCMERWISE